MRKFGTDKPELMSFKLGDSEKVYTIPLAASMPATLLAEMQEAANKGEGEYYKFQLDMLRRYIGEAVDTLTAGDVGDIMNAWVIESSGQGAEVGES